MPRIICPYCYSIFESSSALFQCTNPQRDQDGEYICAREEHDGYNKYWRSDSMIGHIFTPKKKFLSSQFKAEQKCDQCGYVAHDRYVCPSCLNRLPGEMIANGSEIISVIGTPNSGKTNYIVALINELSNHGWQLDLTVTPMQMSRPGHEEESTDVRIQKLNRQLFRQGDVLAQTAVTTRDIPLIFKLSQNGTDKSIYLVFYDTAGESFLNGAEMSDRVRYMKNSSGVIVILDPYSIEYVGDTLKRHFPGNDELIQEIERARDADINKIQNALINFDDNNIYKKPFAFVFSKIDSIINNKEAFGIDVSAFMQGSKYLDSSFKTTGVFDMDAVDETNDALESWLASEEWGAGNFRSFVHRWASADNQKLGLQEQKTNDPGNNYRLFGVSALGAMPENMRIGKVRPFRVMDPLVWVLYKLGKIKIKK